MPCGKVCEKLWNNYLNKYGDYRERLRIIRNDRQCFTHFQLPRLKQQSSTSIKTPVFNSNSRIFHKKCDPLLPSECCGSLVLNKTDRDELEKLIEAENFPDNLFPADTETRPSIDKETELSGGNNIYRLTFPSNSIFSKNNLNYSITQNSEESFMYPISNRVLNQAEKNSSFSLISSKDPTSNRIKNPYAQLLERLRKAEKTKLDQKSVDSAIDTNTHTRIQNLLSFLHSLDDTTDNKQAFDENTLIALFSVDNHLSSSVYVPTNIQQLNIIPQSILHSLRNTSDNEHILNKIQVEASEKKRNELKSNFQSSTRQQSYSNDDSQTSDLIDQDNELNSRLFNTYTIKAFKDFLIHRNKSVRLPKLFHDIDQWSQ